MCIYELYCVYNIIIYHTSSNENADDGGLPINLSPEVVFRDIISAELQPELSVGSSALNPFDELFDFIVIKYI